MNPSDTHFRILVDSVRDYAIYLLDPQGNVQSWNEGARRLKGYRAEEIVGQNFSRFFRPEDAAAGVPRRALETALREGRFEDTGWRVRKDGTQFWANAIVTALHDESGQHIGFAKVTRDLTDAAFRTFVEATHSILWTTDAAGRPNADSPSWRAFTGQTEEAWLRGDSWAPVHPEDLPLLRAEWFRAMQEKRVFEVELRLRRLNGSYVWMGSRAVPLLYPDGGLREWLGVTQDISARRQAEEEREQALVLERQTRVEKERALSLWTTTLRSIGDAVIATDLHGQITFMNPIAESLTSWSAQDAQGKPLTQIFSIVNEETRRVVANPVSKVLQDGTIVGLANHTVLVRRDGTDVPIDDSAAPIRDAEGNLHGAVLVFRDVTHEKRETLRRTFLARAGEALLASTDYRDALSAVATLAVPRLADWCSVEMVEGSDPVPKQLAIAHVDPAKVAYARELNRRYPARADSPTGPVNVIRTGRTEVFREIAPELLEAGARDEEHLRILRRLQFHSAIVVPLRGRERVFGAITFIYAESGRQYSEEDVVLAEELGRRAGLVIERRKLEEERLQLLERERLARKQAELANHAKDEFLAVVSHELRTPLTVILGRAQILSRRNLAEEDRKHLAVIERNARAQNRLVEDVLDVSRIISGKLRLEFQPTDLTGVIHDALVAPREVAQAKGIDLEVQVEPHLEIHADPVRLQQIVANLVNNAVKFTPGGGKVTVEARRESSSLKISVRDTGEGIEPGLLTEIFEPFQQGDASTTRRHGGLGLGLTIVRQLVQAHGGEVHAESGGRGTGATFVVRLPGVLGVAMLAAAGAQHTGARQHLLRDVRVLVVDDQPDALDLFCDFLAGAGAMVESAASAEAALAKLASLRPRVLITDIGMPGEDGYRLLQRVRALPDAGVAQVPAIALTAYARPEDRDAAMAAGFQAHLAKPVDQDRLVAVVARLAGVEARKTPPPR